MAVIEEHPYEITVRFNCEIGENAGETRGCHIVMRSYLVEAGKIVGKIDRGSEDIPKTFPQDKIEALLGARFATFDRQMQELKDDRDDKGAALLQSRSQLLSLGDTVLALQDDLVRASVKKAV